MAKGTDSKSVSQELPLLESGRDGWQIRKHLCSTGRSASRYYTTREVVDLLRISNDRSLCRARRKGSAYLHNPGDLQESSVVVAAGLRNKWLIYKPFSA